jgi:endonuclease/exonuclease/phosphatase (EEP) superfamily protein YafD
MLFWIVVFFAGVCLITSLLPLIPLPHGIFRVWEFPRTQNLIIAAFSLGVAILFLRDDPRAIYVCLALLAAIAVQFYHIARFTPFWRRRSAEYKGDLENVSSVKLLILNVKMGNRDYEKTRQLLRKTKPDIAVFMETDQAWIDALSDVTKDYPHRMECPFDNAYGMHVVSKLRFFEDQTRFLLNPEVPSFDTMVEHPKGGQFRLFVVHPEPPLAIKDTIARDAEIAFVGKMVRNDDQPVIVTGDLNDVAWSRTTRRFLRVSRLLDPREGRGQFNTFDARYRFLRWPLDHIFHSPHFQLMQMTRMSFVSSDHFPMLYRLALTDKEIGRRRVDAATEIDLEEAAELIDIEKDRDNRPVGHDWEETKS